MTHALSVVALHKALSADGDPKLSAFFGEIKTLSVKLSVQPVAP